MCSSTCQEQVVLSWGDEGMLEGTDSKTRDAATNGTRTVGHTRVTLSTPPEAQATGTTQPNGHDQFEALAASAQAIAVPSNPRLAKTGAAPLFA